MLFDKYSLMYQKNINLNDKYDNFESSQFLILIILRIS
jgi:hypothetical protein